MLGREVKLSGLPRRMVSLCPSITETLFALGLDGQLVGLTRYCIHPEDGVVDKVKVGGTKRLKFDVINELEPDLIIAEKEENNREDVERLAERFPVYVTEVRDIPSAFRMIRCLGEVAQCGSEAESMVGSINDAWQKLPSLSEPMSAAYLIWRKPFMAAGADTFIDAVLNRLGFLNVFGEDARYPEFTLRQLAARKPDVVFLSSEPYPFGEKHMSETEMAVPGAEVMLVDGEAFSWYGAHMLPAARYLERLMKLFD